MAAVNAFPRQVESELIVYGFRTKLSTSLAVMELIEEITNATDNKKHAIGVFIDLKKAFDTVDHGILIKKLEHYGVRGAASDWLKSYLSNRKQFVNIDGCSSELLDVICGVPQGSILGPTLFILYINDICNVSNLVKFILFADDTNVFCAGDNKLELECMLNRELAKLCKWFAVNKLSLNLSKTSYMLFRNRPPDVDFNVFIEHERINRVHVTKFLGIYIDDKLNWKYHINTVRSKLSKVAAIIYRASCLINQDGIYMLYCSLFLPYINYCSEIWGNTYCTNVECITVLQKRVVRLVCGARRLDHTNPLFKQLGILKFVDLVKFKTSIIMFKAYHNVLPDSLQKMFTLRVQIYDTRQKCTFTVHRAHTNVKSMCISIYGVKLWNSLHTDLTNSRSLQVFKKM